jgi:hypothetical protein
MGGSGKRGVQIDFNQDESGGNAKSKKDAFNNKQENKGGVCPWESIVLLFPLLPFGRATTAGGRRAIAQDFSDG